MDNYDEARGAYDLAIKDAERLYEENERLKQRLSSLLAAVEPIVARITEAQKSCPQISIDDTCILVSVGDLRTLSTVAAGIREGKK